MTLIEKITTLKKEKNAVILAHYYQDKEIQDIADFVGDSLELSKRAAESTADIIVFSGVHFMAETAKLLNPSKTVVLPDVKAGCSLADSCPPKKFQEFINANPDHTVITYINCSAEIKAISDLVCTSSNAVKIIESVLKEKPIIFAPDKNLGKYLAQKTGRDLLLWDGSCIVHEAFSIEKLLELHKKHPDAVIIAHPESEAHILKTASYIGSTSGMISYVKEHPKNKFIVATEAGILHKMQQEAPNTILIPAPSKVDNTCACSECAYMRINTLQKLYDCLKNESPKIEIPSNIREKAVIPIQKMLTLSA
ncbi:quinolinate synthase NadA [uncultured Maribacter sp.]|uniref:quinolinate synthase NadA n=1 Tax=uncultured Maribacter sp. TaxID=431308 RepID=UPI00262ACF7D|nr:quinolinate synthase NadA [uncultured Maribacter sp.]